jgi:hypothetical protein
MSASPIITQPEAEIMYSPDASPPRVGPIKLQESWKIRELQVTQSQPIPRPERLLLGTLSDLKFRVIKPIHVEVEFREDTVITSWEAIEEFGTGASVYSSAQDLGRTLAELYRALQVDQDNLGPEMQRVWAILQEHVVPRR